MNLERVQINYRVKVGKKSKIVKESGKLDKNRTKDTVFRI